MADLIEKFWLYYDVWTLLVTIAVLAKMGRFDRKSWLKVAGLVFVVTSIGVAISVSYMHYKFRITRGNGVKWDVRQLDATMQLNQALPYYRMIARHDPAAFSQLYITVFLGGKARAEMSDTETALDLHEQSFVYARQYFCSASDHALAELMRRHQNFIAELYHANYFLLLKFQYPKFFGLMQLEDVSNIRSYPAYLEGLDAVIASGARREKRCEAGKGMNISGKFRDVFTKKYPDYMERISALTGDETSDKHRLLAEGLIVYYDEILKLPPADAILLWRRLVERN